MQTKNIIIAVLALVLIGAIGALLFIKSSDTTVVVKDAPINTDTSLTPTEPAEEVDNTNNEQEQEAPTNVERPIEMELGKSVGGQEIVAYHFGKGSKEILLIGGVHGGYSPNTTELAEDVVSYFRENASSIPNNLSVTIIPNLNPDGSDKTGEEGRFNNNTVDLNRNFDCEWNAISKWQDKEVSGGSSPFSEPEAAALRDYVQRYEPEAAVVWFGAEGKVYPSACGRVPSKASIELAATYASATGYPAQAEFDAYAITGDMVNWMAKQGIPAISVLLTDHKNAESYKNLAGVKAILNKYAE